MYIELDECLSSLFECLFYLWLTLSVLEEKEEWGMVSEATPLSVDFVVLFVFWCFHCLRFDSVVFVSYIDSTPLMKFRMS